MDDNQQMTVTPGLSQVFVAGMVYTLEDNDGNEAEIECKLDPETVAFLRAFDNYAALKVRTGPETQVTRAAWAALIEKWNELGNHAKKEIAARVA